MTNNQEEKIAVSKCCEANVDYTGGGYDGEDIVPILTICSSCKQTLNENGNRFFVELINPDTGRVIKKRYSKRKTIIYKEQPK